MNLQAFIEEKITKYRLALSGLIVFIGAMAAMTGGAAAMSYGGNGDNHYNGGYDNSSCYNSCGSYRSYDDYNSSPCQHNYYQQYSDDNSNCPRYVQSNCDHNGDGYYYNGCQHPCDN